VSVTVPKFPYKSGLV